MMKFNGKGYWLWKLGSCEGGNAKEAARVAKEAGLTHALFKVMDGAKRMNVTFAKEFIDEFRAQGITPVGWGYSYGTKSGAAVSTEGSAIAMRILELGLYAYVVDAEMEYKEAGGGAYGKSLFKYITDNLGELKDSVSIGFSTFRFPVSHPAFPWRDFILTYDFTMPQVYWMEAHNPGEQLQESLYQYELLFKKWKKIPYYPVGATFSEHGWTPTTTEVQEFLDTAQKIGLPAVNFWEWGDARNREGLMPLWETVANYMWQDITPPPPPPFETPIGQLQVLSESLHIRRGAGTYSAVCGHTYKNTVYYCFETAKDNRGYSWGRIGVNTWIAIRSQHVEYCRWIT